MKPIPKRNWKRYTSRFEKLGGETVSSGAPKYICEDGYGERSTTMGETPSRRDKECSFETGLPYRVTEEVAIRLVEI